MVRRHACSCSSIFRSRKADAVPSSSYSKLDSFSKLDVVPFHLLSWKLPSDVIFMSSQEAIVLGTELSTPNYEYTFRFFPFPVRIGILLSHILPAFLQFTVSCAHRQGGGKSQQPSPERRRSGTSTHSRATSVAKHKLKAARLHIHAVSDGST